ncbi:MAG: uL15 family ribosomal protein [Candidatus Aenigmarchaeota archaeon]|nr:uL15 family ribosomal protein [Candidatus Aenigmarchaeota archaeon]
MKVTGSTNPELKKIILSLKKLKKYPALVKHLERPRRKKSSLNVADIEKMNEHKIATVEVLGAGDLSRAVTVYSWRYSASAKEKIHKSGGKALSLDDLVRNKDDVVIV